MGLFSKNKKAPQGQVNVPYMPDGSEQGFLEKAGIYTPSQRKAMAAQRQQEIQLQQQQLAAYQAQIAEQTRNNDMQEAQLGINYPVYMAAQGGKSAGNLLGSLFDRVRGGGQQAEAPAEQPDPEAGGMTPRVEQRKYDRFAQKTTPGAADFQAAGNDPMQARMNMAAQLLSHPDPYFRQKGEQLLMQLRNEKLAYDKEQSVVDKNRADARQSNSSATKTDVELNREGIVENIKVGDSYKSFKKRYTPDGRIILEEFASGNPTQRTSTSGPETKGDQSKDYTDFRDYLESQEGAIRSMRTVRAKLREGNAKIGWAGKGVALASDVIGTLSQLTGEAKVTDKAQAALQEYTSGTDFKTIAQQTGITESILADLVSELAKGYNPTGTITEKDVARAASVIGAARSDPSVLDAVLGDVERRVRDRVRTKFSYKRANAPEMKDLYDQFDRNLMEEGDTPAVTGGWGKATVVN